jgi:inner membrane protein
MEPLTHFLTGACIARAGLNRSTGYATLAVTLAAEFPDVDILWNLSGPVTGFAHHRGFTHSLVGAPVDSLIVLGCVYAFHKWRLRRGKSSPLAPRWGLLYLFGIVAVLSHILLDFTNNYGVRPFLPFSWRWYSWDIVFIVEPLILLALIAGLVLPAIFALVGSEIGARKEQFRGRWSAVAALIAVCLLWWVRDYQHRKSVTMLRSTDYRGEVVRTAAAMPYPVDPFVWSGIVETQSFYAKVPIDFSTPAADLPDRAQVFYKPPETPVVSAAKSSQLGRVYLDWARFPWIETESLREADGAYAVRFRDLRFDYSPFTFLNQRQSRTPLSAQVVLDHNLHVVTMQIGNREQKP